MTKNHPTPYKRIADTKNIFQQRVSQLTRGAVYKIEHQVKRDLVQQDNEYPSFPKLITRLGRKEVRTKSYFFRFSAAKSICD